MDLPSGELRLTESPLELFRRSTGLLESCINLTDGLQNGYLDMGR